MLKEVDENIWNEGGSFAIVREISMWKVFFVGFSRKNMRL